MLAVIDEVWKDVPSISRLEASSWGRLRLKIVECKMPHGGIRRYGGTPVDGVTVPTSGGFRKQWNYKRKNYKVHRLVCEAFHGPAPFPGAVVMHLDDDAMNNRPTNLRWGTQKENLNTHGFLAYCRSRIGENNPRTKGARRTAPGFT